MGKRRNFSTASERIKPIVQELVADLLTPVSAFLRLKKSGQRAFLLESVEGGERLARYSFLGVRPECAWFIRDGKLWRHPEGEDAQELPGNPIRNVSLLLEKYRSDSAPGLPPFYGGLVGYVGYDCVSLLEPRVPHPSGSSLFPYDAYLMLFKTVVAFDHVRHRIILVSNASSANTTSGRKDRARALRETVALQKALGIAAAGETQLCSEAVGRKAASERQERLEAIFKPSLGKKRFFESVRSIKRHIRKGDIFQCVLSEQFSFHLKGDPFEVYRSLRATSPSPYLFYLALGDKGDDVVLGASPEMLTRVEGRRVQSCPIAGTRPRADDPARDRVLERQLLTSVKERAEHLMLVDLGRNDIGRIAAPGTVTVPEFMQVHRFSHVMHLVSNVEGKLAPGRSAWDAFFSCFPAGTLTGAPKIRAMQIIHQNEIAARGPYGGAVVYQGFSGNLDSCITIRSLFASKGRGVIQAGAGVVADSRPQSEYQEVLNKTRAIRWAVLASGAIKGRGAR